MANLQCGTILIQVHVFILQNPLIIGYGRCYMLSAYFLLYAL